MNIYRKSDIGKMVDVRLTGQIVDVIPETKSAPEIIVVEFDTPSKLDKLCLGIDVCDIHGIGTDIDNIEPI